MQHITSKRSFYGKSNHTDRLKCTVNQFESSTLEKTITIEEQDGTRPELLIDENNTVL